MCTLAVFGAAAACLVCLVLPIVQIPVPRPPITPAELTSLTLSRASWAIRVLSMEGKCDITCMRPEQLEEEVSRFWREAKWLPPGDLRFDEVGRLLDGWGHRIRYRHGGYSVDSVIAYSVGPNGKDESGQGDDISWAPILDWREITTPADK